MSGALPAVEGSSSRPDARTLATRRLMTVDRLLELDRIGDAERQARLALEADPTFARAHAALARCFLARGALVDADEASKAAIRQAPGDHEVYHTRLSVLRERADLAGAMTIADEMVRMAPTCTTVHQQRAWILRDRHRPVEALAAADEMLRLAPSSGEALNERFLCLIRLGRMSEAEAVIRAALKLQPNSAIYMNNLGVIERLRGDLSESRDRFREAARLNPASDISVRNVETSEAFLRQREVQGIPLRRRNRIFGLNHGALAWWARRTSTEKIGTIAALGAAGFAFGAAWVLILPAIWSWIGLALQPRLERRWASATERRFGRLFRDPRSWSFLAIGTAMLMTARSTQPLAGLLGILLLPSVFLVLARVDRERRIALVVLVTVVAVGIVAEATIAEASAVLSLALWSIALYGSWLSPAIVARLVGLSNRAAPAD